MGLQKLEADKYLDAYQLLQKVFIPADLRYYDTYLEMLDKKVYTLLGYIEDTELKGVVLLIELENHFFVENLGIDPKYQSQGLGSKILKSLKSNTNKNLVLEVEEDEDLEKRLRFYNRNGFNLYKDEFYYLPQINDSINPNKMYLMATNQLDSASYKEICKEIFDKVYAK